MALQTLIFASVADESGEARLELDIDDTTDPTNWNIIRGRVVNNMTRPCYVLFRRGNGQPWFEREVLPGETIAQDSGGPIRRESDLRSMMLTTR